MRTASLWILPEVVSVCLQTNVVSDRPSLVPEVFDDLAGSHVACQHRRSLSANSVGVCYSSSVHVRRRFPSTAGARQPSSTFIVRRRRCVLLSTHDWCTSSLVVIRCWPKSSVIGVRLPSTPLRPTCLQHSGCAYIEIRQMLFWLENSSSYSQVIL